MLAAPEWAPLGTEFELSRLPRTFRGSERGSRPRVDHWGVEPQRLLKKRRRGTGRGSIIRVCCECAVHGKECNGRHVGEDDGAHRAEVVPQVMAELPVSCVAGRATGRAAGAPARATSNGGSAEGQDLFAHIARRVLRMVHWSSSSRTRASHASGRVCRPASLAAEAALKRLSSTLRRQPRAAATKLTRRCKQTCGKKRRNGDCGALMQHRGLFHGSEEMGENESRERSQSRWHAACLSDGSPAGLQPRAVRPCRRAQVYQRTIWSRGHFRARESRD